MKEIKFSVKYDPVLSVTDKDFKTKYNEQIGDNIVYTPTINGDKKYLAICPLCNNPVVILGIFKKIDRAPHARHAKGINILGVAEYNEYKYEHCPYHIKKADYVKEYVPETEEPLRQEIYRIAKEHFDKAIYLLKRATGIYITPKMAENFAENYAAIRAYNYIDATVYNIPWYLIYSYQGISLYQMIIRKDSALYNHLAALHIKMDNSYMKDHVYVKSKGYVLTATNYRYVVNNDDEINEWLDFSILQPNDNAEDTLLYEPIDRFSINVEPYYFRNLINYEEWTPQVKMLDIAKKYMNP
jgi:hypothetical protein